MHTVHTLKQHTICNSYARLQQNILTNQTLIVSYLLWSKTPFSDEQQFTREFHRSYTFPNSQTSPSCNFKIIVPYRINAVSLIRVEVPPPHKPKCWNIYNSYNAHLMLLQSFVSVSIVSCYQQHYYSSLKPNSINKQYRHGMSSNKSLAQ